MNLHNQKIVCHKNSNLLNFYEKHNNNKTIKKLYEAKHYLPSNKEWINSVYAFNQNSTINLPVKDKILYKLLKSYFNIKNNKLNNFNKNNLSFSSYRKKKANSKSILSLINNCQKNDSLKKTIDILKSWKKAQKNNNFTSIEKIPFNKNIFYRIWKRRLLKLKNKKNKQMSVAKRTYLSLPDIKHYNNKSIITVSIYSRDKNFFKRKVYKYYKLFIEKKKKHVNKTKALNSLKLLSKEKKISFANFLSKYKFYNKKLMYNVFIKLNYLSINTFSDSHNHKNNLMTNNNFVSAKLIAINPKLEEIKKVNHILRKKVEKIKHKLTKKYKKVLMYKYYLLNLCFIKFRHNNSSLIGLKNIVRKLYGKKVVLKIINLKYMYLDSNIVTEIMTRRLKNRKKKLLRTLKKVIKKIKRVSIVKGIWLENLNFNLNTSTYNDENKVLNMSRIYLPLSPVDLVLYKEYLMRSKDNIRSLVLYNINNKAISGIRVQGSGRLTKRLTASRSVTKIKGKGSLKNINSSYHKISTQMIRGYLKSNLQYMNVNNHRRNGSFGMKTWISSY